MARTGPGAPALVLSAEERETLERWPGAPKAPSRSPFGAGSCWPVLKKTATRLWLPAWG